MTWQQRLDELVATLERERDELRVKMNLAAKEARDELDALDGRLDELRAKAKSAFPEAKETAGDVGDVMSETARKLAADLREGYDRIRARLAE